MIGMRAWLLPLALAGCHGTAMPADRATATPSAATVVRPDERLAFTGFVVDDAHLLSDEDRRRLTTRLDRFQHETLHQMAIVTVSDLGGEPVADYSRRLANRWGVGRRGYDDGIVLLVTPHASRIEIGRGLERVLPDAFCRHVMDDIMAPAFQRGAFGEGLAAGAEALMTRLAAADAARPESPATPPSRS